MLQKTCAHIVLTDYDGEWHIKASFNVYVRPIVTTIIIYIPITYRCISGSSVWYDIFYFKFSFIITGPNNEIFVNLCTTHKLIINCVPGIWTSYN